MDANKSMNGRYWSICSKDISSSEGWLKNVMKLGLLMLVPVFGLITLYGYAYEWAHKVAWGVKSPMPRTIFGRRDSKLLRWGWFALVIAVVAEIIPAIISRIGEAIAGASLGGASLASSYGSMMVGTTTGLLGSSIGGILQLAAFVLSIALIVVVLVASLRMTIYDRLGAGFQVNQLWKMIKKDPIGLLRILGMYALGCAIMIFVGLVVALILSLTVIAIAAPGMVGLAGGYASGSLHGISSSVIGSLLMAAAFVIPFILAYLWALCCVSAWLQLLATRATGYWIAQFDVPHWGRQEDPLPFEKAAQPAPAAPQTPAASPAAPAAAPAAAPSTAPAPAPAPTVAPVADAAPAAETAPAPADESAAAKPEEGGAKPE